MLKFEMEEQQLLDGLVNAISALPDSDAYIERRDVAIALKGRADGVVSAKVAGCPLTLVIEAKRDAFPRDVRESIYQLRNYLTHLPRGSRDVVPFFIARAISPGARDLLRDEGVGFYDSGGTLYIPAKNAFVYIDRPVPRKSSKAFDSVFRGRKARVVQEVFERRPQWLSVKQIAEDTEVSPATASATLTEMERREWVEAQGAGPFKLRRLRATRPLLDAWTAFIADQKSPKLARYYVPHVDTDTLPQRLDAACQDANAAYAVTGEAAAQTYSPFLTNVSQLRCRIVPGPRQQDILERLRARPVSEGWNLGLIETRTPGDVTVGERRDGICLAPALQVYLDLLQSGGRSKELAMHLRAERLED